MNDVGKLVSIVLVISLSLGALISIPKVRDLYKKYSMGNELLSSVAKPWKVRGQLWPNVDGPSLGDHVCIVGAGPAGVHMALELKRRNFNVELIEKSSRIGGKS